MFVTLGTDDTPMVRRAATKALGVGTVYFRLSNLLLTSV
jgi:hypothetical protein